MNFRSSHKEINDFNTFLSSATTKDLLAMYLAKQLVQNSEFPIVAVTRNGVSSSNAGNVVLNLNSNHEEADTLLILYAAEVFKLGANIHIYSQDTDVLVLALSTQPGLGSEQK